MRKICLALFFTTLLSTPLVFANIDSTTDGQPCKTVAKACVSAGFSGKNFWFNCMKPVILGKNVNGVTLDSNIVKSCRTDKIAKLQKELQELTSANS